MENAKEYKQILKLETKENARDTMYVEILNLVVSFETGIAFGLEKNDQQKVRKLQQKEVDNIFKHFPEHPLQRPHIDDSRAKMASRYLHFRDAFHKKLEEYMQSISPADFERFLGE